MLTSEERKRLAEIEARAGKADPGPWRHELIVDRRIVLTRRGTFIVAGDGGPDDPQEYIDRFDFLAESRMDVPWLVALVKRLAGEGGTDL